MPLPSLGSRSYSSRALGLLLGLVGLLSEANAVDLGSVALHGSLSSTASYSNRYDYLGNTAKNAYFNSTEAILNGNYRFTGGLRLSAQLYGYQLGDYEALTVDFAAFDYSFSKEVGLRAGRVKHASGLHGESQDLDILRPFAYLPLDFYNKSLRPFSASIDGATLYGNVRLGRSSVDYQIFGGWLPEVDLESPFVTTISDSAVLNPDHISTIPLFGGSVIWNTPVEGLRVSTSASFIPRVIFSGKAKTAAQLNDAVNDLRLIPSLFPPGFWDILAAGRAASIRGDFTLLYAFIDYTRGNWQFSAEATTARAIYDSSTPLFGSSTATSRSESYYTMVTWQAAPNLQFGTYYALAYSDAHDHGGRRHRSVPSHTSWLKDFSFATSYNFTSWWLIKAEGHLLDGTRGLGATGNGNAATWQSHWTYFAAKTAVSF